MCMGDERLHLGGIRMRAAGNWALQELSTGHYARMLDMVLSLHTSTEDGMAAGERFLLDVVDPVQDIVPARDQGVGLKEEPK